MASIHRRENLSGPTWQVRWRVNGKPKTRVEKTHEAARRVKLAVELHGDYTPTAENDSGVPTVRQQAETYLAVHTRAQAPTLREYRRIIDQHILPSFGDVMVTYLNVTLLSTWARGLVQHDRHGNPLPDKPLSDKSRANVTSVLSGILESAVPEWLPANPWHKVRLVDQDGPKDQQFLTWEEFGLIVAEIPEHYRALVVTLGTTGMRWGEAAALSVGDVTIHDGRPVFRITKAMKHRAGQTDKPGVPKTRKAVRSVKGPPELTPYIQALIHGRPKTAPLFPTVNGKRIRNSTFHTLVWQDAITRAEAQGLSFRPRIHDLRAAATSWALEDGERIEVVADMLGHESTETTNRIYRRVNPDAGTHFSDIMSAGLRRALPPSGL